MDTTAVGFIALKNHPSPLFAPSPSSNRLRFLMADGSDRKSRAGGLEKNKKRGPVICATSSTDPRRGRCVCLLAMHALSAKCYSWAPRTTAGAGRSAYTARKKCYTLHCTRYAVAPLAPAFRPLFLQRTATHTLCALTANMAYCLLAGVSADICCCAAPVPSRAQLLLAGQ
jgi:hypothetical protein